MVSSKYAGAGIKQVRSGLFPTSSRNTEFSFKLDHTISTAAQVSARYAFSRGKVNNGVEGADNFADFSARGNSRTVDHSLVTSWVHVPTARLVNELRFQLARRSVDLTPNSAGPMLEIPGVLTLGQSYRLNASRREDHGEIVESVNYSAGRSQFNIGFNLHQVRFDARMANRFAGVYLFPTLADFLNGRPDVFFQAFGNPATNFSTLPMGLWLQDRWQPLAGLTLEAGFRYDRQRMPSGLPSSSDNLAPRLGLAWKPGRNSHYVLRAGFGLFHDRYPLAFLNDAIQKNGTAAFEQYLAGAGAVGAFDVSRGGALAASFPGVKPSIYVADPHFVSTYSRKLTGGVERSLGIDTRLTLEYNWVRGFHLPRVRNTAISLPAAYGLEQSARSAYQGGSISINRRMRKELTYLLTYNLGRTHDDGSDFDEQPFEPSNVRADWTRVSHFYAVGGERLGSYGHEVETLNARQVQIMVQFEF